MGIITLAQWSDSNSGTREPRPAKLTTSLRRENDGGYGVKTPIHTFYHSGTTERRWGKLGGYLRGALPWGLGGPVLLRGFGMSIRDSVCVCAYVWALLQFHMLICYCHPDAQALGTGNLLI